MVVRHKHGVQHGLNVLGRSKHECVEHESVEQMPVSVQQAASRVTRASSCSFKVVLH